MKPVTVEFVDTEIKTALNELESQAGIKFVYTSRLVPLKRKVTLRVSNKSMAETLDALFSPDKVTYRIVRNRILLSVEEEEKSSQLDLPSPELYPVFTDRTVRGTVKDEQGEGLPGVSIILKGTQRGTVSATDGSFEIVLPDGENTLIFSFVGYLTQEIEVGNRTTIEVGLEVDQKSLEEVVVVGYGTQKKSDLTGSVVSVNEKDFTQGVNNSALQLLNGRAAGVQISQSSSAPGGATSIRIRGAGSINSSNEALIVIDGLPGASTTSISPEDIESIQILKDASATAIYGSRAANGVVLITTKKGKKGPPRINYNAYVGMQNVARKIDMLSASEYMQVLNELSVSQNGTPRFTPDQISAVGDGTNWQNEIFRTAAVHNHQLSASGGSDHSSFYLGANYLDQAGVVKGSSLKKYNVRLNYELTPGDKLKINLNLNTNRSINTAILTTNSGNENAGPINTAIQFDPTISNQKDDAGRYLFNPLISLENPLALIEGFTNNLTSNRTFGTLSTDYSITKDWGITLRLGADIENTRNDSYNSTLTQRGLASGGIGNVNTSEELHWISELFTTYNRTFGNNHNLTLLAGTTREKYDNRRLGASSIGFLSDVTLTNLLQSGDGERGDNVTSGRTTNKLNSYLGRINYALKETYLLTASLRADGTSRFSDKNKYAFFPSLAVGWRISEEAFMKSQKLISDMKLRLSYGQSGNQAIGNFETLQTFTVGAGAILGGGLLQGVEPARIPNADLRWESTEEFDIGLDFGLFGNRLTGAIEYYIKNTRDQLFNKPLPRTSGFNNIRVNFGEVRNTGVDIMLTSRNLIGAFKWSTTATLSTLRNKVVSLPDFIPQIITGGVGFTSNYAIVKEGYPMRAYYGYEVERLFQQDDNIRESAQPNAQPGHPKFKDQNNDGKIDPNDRVILGSPFPRLVMGLSNDFSYKKFQANILFTAAQGIHSLDNNIVESLYPINFERNRMRAHYLERWTPENTGAKYPSGINPSSYGGALAVNSLTITDASFLRLKTVSLAYTILEGSGKISRLNVSLAGDNLFTLTGFQGFDPDANSSGTGVERASYNAYPLNRTIRLGISLGF